MPDSIFDDQDDEARTLVDEIVLEVNALPTTEAEFLKAIDEIYWKIRKLDMPVWQTPLNTVEEWIDALRNIPEQIGIGAEFSEEAQTRIQQIRERIATKLDIDWPESAGSCLINGDSGINMGIGSGILLR